MRRLYRALLKLLPAPFRNEYGGEMEAVFVERLRQSSGGLGAALIAADAIADVIGCALRVHLDLLGQDLRYASRMIARSPGFAFAVIAVTALGIGANTAVFTVADYVLMRPLNFAEPERLVKVWEDLPGYRYMEFSPANLRDFEDRSQSFEAMGAYYETTANLSGNGAPQHVRGAQVSVPTLRLLGVQPAMGRGFATDDATHEASTVILSHGLWAETFASDPGIVGERVLLDDRPYKVVGVMPAGFHFPARETQYWAPLYLPPQAYEDRNDNMLEVVARLREGVTLAQAREEMQRIAAQLAIEYPSTNEKVSAHVVGLGVEISERAGMLLWALLGASLCVLLIACANLANLLIARAAYRDKELALRALLGAGRERLLRQLLTENSVLAVAGGVLGIAVAQASLPLLIALAPARFPIAVPSIDLRILAFSGGLILLTTIGFGVYPAMRASGQGGASAVRAGTRGGAGARRERLRSTLVVAEIAIAVVLVVTGGLLLEALWRVRDVHPGFRTEGVVTIRTVLPMPRYASVARRRQFYDKVREEATRLPGVRSAAYISFLPMTMTGGIWPVNINGKTYTREGAHTASLRYTTPGFFATMGIPLVDGRAISAADTAETPPVAVVSKKLAERYWPNESAIGREFEFAFSVRRIVGVVEDIRVRGLEQESEPQVYLPAAQQPDEGLLFYSPKDLAVCCVENPASVTSALRRIIHEADPELAIAAVRTMQEIVDAETASRQLQLNVLGVFGGLALLLAGIGIHGLLSFAVARRAPEIGVRMALGATRSGILRLVVRESLVLGVVGIGIGAGLGYVAGHMLQAALAGVSPYSPVAVVPAVVTGLGMTLIGSLLPAVRAVRVDPTNVIRAE